jgi:helicase MOV-10
MIVLAGDPQQLGPIIRSPYAIRNGNGLARSMLERIISSNAYKWNKEFSGYGNYDPRFITKLVNNYRSHPEILKLPNEARTCFLIILCFSFVNYYCSFSTIMN